MCGFAFVVIWVLLSVCFGFAFGVFWICFRLGSLRLGLALVCVPCSLRLISLASALGRVELGLALADVGLG